MKKTVRISFEGKTYDVEVEVRIRPRLRAITAGRASAFRALRRRGRSMPVRP